MTPYIDDKIPEEIKEVFGQIRNIVKKMPDVDLGKTDRNYPIYVSCHMVARAIKELYPFLKNQDGYFTHWYEHSWLVVTPTLLIDPYPWAMMGGPILVSSETNSPWFKLYEKPKGDRVEYFRKMCSSARFREQTEMVAGAARGTALHLGYLKPNRSCIRRKLLCEEKRN